jgi:glycine/D-amino acid oxidase-like deaminating enzyme/nitrite reductase/ring-hydroxylating ferredoxin subunit
MTDRIIANDSGSTRSIWMAETVPDYRSVVPGEARPQVCVVGAGIAGLSVALALAQQQTDVLVLDQGPIGGGETARTSAHLSSAVDERYHVLERRFGRAAARLVAESHAVAIDVIEANVRAFVPDCEFRRVDGYLFAAPGQSQRLLARELEAARRAGLACDAIEHAPLPFDTGPCLRYANQAEFHPLAYLRGLASAIVGLGGRICTGVHVAAIRGGDPVQVELANGRMVRARAVVDATNSTISSRLDIPTREAAYRTYIVALAIERGYVPHALYWDTGDPYHYVRVASAAGWHEVLVVGGEDHRVGQSDPAEHWPELERWARERFPFSGAVVARWSGQVEEPADGLAYIGRHHHEQGVFVVTGDSGNGLTHGTIAGLIVPALLEGRDHPWAPLYAPDRTRMHGLGTFAAEAARSNAPYADWLRAGDVESLDAIAPGQGATIRRGLHVIAAFRDDAGNCHLRNARCPHLSGVVRWNEVEQTWDCPCHGSRFDPYGRVIHGPAPSDLADPPEQFEQPALVGRSVIRSDELVPEV